MVGRKITYWQAIYEAIDQMMEKDSSIFIIGEGVTDPKGIFKTTLGLERKYGKDRVFDMPISENAITGVCIGAAISGLRPILVHQRIDFTLLAMDQIINNAAKWSYMFGGNSCVPFLMRVIIGQGWGQGPQHSQNLQATYAHIPGLKVVMPSTAKDVKGIIIASLKQNNPVICIEHRWLYNILDEVPIELYEVPIGKSRIIKKGYDMTICATSIMVIEALKAAKFLEKFGISVEVVDLVSIKPIDFQTIFSSIKKTKNLLVCDSGYKSYGVAAEIISSVCSECFSILKNSPSRITLPDIPTPTSVGLSKYYYPTYKEICIRVAEMLNKDIKFEFPELKLSSDVPDDSFQGPF